jgi:hypothetical protein
VLVAWVVIVVSIVSLSIGLTIVEFRKLTPLGFRCGRCGLRFTQPPHHDYPQRCPRCHAGDWAD